ncbi:MAG: sugar ABC transporter ATP-binding protein [Lachnospiraceae bacterium]|nr:sugar ABC transporter ATP-binding protein [Lachnospiraceae bacterium]
MDNNLLLEMKQIDKHFTGVHALDQVDFAVRKGEIHALMGENGAGKSTLVKVLTGLYGKDSGQIIFDGEERSFPTPQDSQNAGISTIYQEINLIPHLSVAENIFIGREPKNVFGIDWKAVRSQARQLLLDNGIDIDVTQDLATYSTAIQQMVAITRAISQNAKLLIMDEPTSSLAEDEIQVMFEKMRELVAKGMSIIFISHKLDEVYTICDRATILKDGKLVGSYDIDKISRLEMVSKMIGRDASNVLKRSVGEYEAKEGTAALLHTKDIDNRVKLHGISIDIRPGEIVGVAGLLGAGKTEFAKVVFGCDNTYTGEIEVEGKPIRMNTPKGAIDLGFAYCSEDRKVEGIFPHMSVKENMTITALSRISKFGVVDTRKQKEIVDKYIDSIRIKTPSPDQLICNLSGGNQQKVLLGRWLSMDPKLIILDEPTRGIDVGAKAEIEALIKQFSENGISVLYISSELEELIRNCYRVVVIRDGMNSGELTGEDITEANIMNYIAKNMKETEEAHG